jgi:hypothetical protein
MALGTSGRPPVPTSRPATEVYKREVRGVNAIPEGTKASGPTCAPELGVQSRGEEALRTRGGRGPGGPGEAQEGSYLRSGGGGAVEAVGASSATRPALVLTCRAGEGSVADIVPSESPRFLPAALRDHRWCRVLLTHRPLSTLLLAPLTHAAELRICSPVSCDGPKQALKK